MGHCTKPKNKLESDIIEHFKSLDCTLIEEGKFEEFSIQIGKKMAELNNKHHRCKAVSVYVDLRYGDSGEHRVAGLYCMNFYVYQVKNNL